MKKFIKNHLKLVSTLLFSFVLLISLPSLALALDMPVAGQNGWTESGWTDANIETQRVTSQALYDDYWYGTKLKAETTDPELQGKPGYLRADQMPQKRAGDIQNDLAELKTLKEANDLIKQGKLDQAAATNYENGLSKDLEKLITGSNNNQTSWWWYSGLQERIAENIALGKGDAKTAETHKAGADHSFAVAKGETVNPFTKQFTGTPSSPLEAACVAATKGKFYDSSKFWFSECWLYGAASALMWVVWLFGLILRLVNEVFNLVVNFSVVGFSDFANKYAFKYIWSICRDLVNVSLLFLLLYAAIGMVLDAASIHSRNIVKNVILVALFINFSFFLTNTAIKSSNTVAKFLYDKAGEVCTAKKDTAGNIGEDCVPPKAGKTPDIATRIFGKRLPLNFGKLDRGQLAGEAPQQEQKQKYLQATLGGIIGNFFSDITLTLITAVVLGAGVVMFTVRFVKLMLVLILSPLAFLGFAVGSGKLKGKADEWLSILVSMCIFPIVFLLFLLLVSKVGSSGSTAFGGEGFVGSLIFAIVINGLMVGGLIAANAMGATGGNAAMGMLKGLGDKAKGFAGQHTIGRAGYMLNKGLEGSDFAARHTFIGGALKNVSAKIAGSKLGGKGGSFQKRVDDQAKGADQFKDPARKAQYIANLGGTARQAAYDKMDAKGRAGLETAMEKQKQEYAEAASKEDTEKIDNQITERNQSLNDVSSAMAIEAKTKENEVAKQIKNQELAEIENRINSDPYGNHAALNEERTKKLAEIANLDREVDDMKQASPQAEAITKEAEEAKRAAIAAQEKELAEINKKYNDISTSGSAVDRQQLTALGEARRAKGETLNNLKAKSALVMKQENLVQEISNLKKAKKEVIESAGKDSPVVEQQNIFKALRDKLAKKDPSVAKKIADAKMDAINDARIKELEAIPEASRTQIEKEELKTKLEQQRNRELEEIKAEMAKRKKEDGEKGGGEKPKDESGGGDKK